MDTILRRLTTTSEDSYSSSLLRSSSRSRFTPHHSRQQHLLPINMIFNSNGFYKFLARYSGKFFLWFSSSCRLWCWLGLMLQCNGFKGLCYLFISSLVRLVGMSLLEFHFVGCNRRFFTCIFPMIHVNESSAQSSSLA